MRRLQPSRLQVTFLEGVELRSLAQPRRYTLTHSDRTGELYLSIGREFNKDQTSGLYTRLMRDEVLAEWGTLGEQRSLHVYCHVSGGLVLGGAKWRYSVFQRELPLVLEALRHGDRNLFSALPELDEAHILVHFISSKPLHNKIEDWRRAADYA